MNTSLPSLISLFACGLVLTASALPAAPPPPTPLAVPQDEAFAILGHSCGGIQEQSFATGFAPSTGLPMGDVYLQTRCGGSGRGGGYHTTTYSAWLAVTWDFAGNVVSTQSLSAAPTTDPAFSATDADGDHIYNMNNAAFLTVPAPGAPTITRAIQSGDDAEVTWTTAGVNPAAVVSSTLTARPAGTTGGAVVRRTINGPATRGPVGPLQPQTAYEITLVDRTVGGAGAASAAVVLTTEKASVPPSAPTGVRASWTTAGLATVWLASKPGDAPVDEYEVTIRGSDGGGTFKKTVGGAAREADFGVDTGPDWTVTERAHNAAGWSGNSAGYTLGGL